ncbi:MAG: polyhydroxyalkanoate depolymerase [Minwuia sp.]|uniref:polyhydroxyalkanoate depolymerase n=1 Tax=Minwuia sp. TaxID=2493630 RepID=UPI003A888BDC
MLYQLYEMNHAAITPFRAAAQVTQALLRNPMNPAAYTLPGRTAAAAADVFESITRRYGKPSFGIDEVLVDGHPVPVTEQIVMRKPFGQLKYFKKDRTVMSRKTAEMPRVLIVAPLSGHYATLLRGTVQGMLPEHDVFITDWRDARQVPVSDGSFGLADYVDYVIDFLHVLGPNTHVIAVCQPGPAVLAATALMSEDNDPCAPATLTIMGSPIDPRKSPTVPNELATSRPLEWFKSHVITPVPLPHPGFTRRVYPGFLQLTGFMTMNLDRHIDAHRNLFDSLIKGDGDSAQAHRTFYDEYLSVLDLDAAFYLDTIEIVFQKFDLPNGNMLHRGRKVDTSKIKKTALFTVEGENDDISGIGQTQAAHDICTGIPDNRQADYIQANVGHYGVFNGSRFRNEIQPRIRDFIRSFRTLGA